MYCTSYWNQNRLTKETYINQKRRVYRHLYIWHVYTSLLIDISKRPTNQKRPISIKIDLQKKPISIKRQVSIDICKKCDVHTSRLIDVSKRDPKKRPISIKIELQKKPTSIKRDVYIDWFWLPIFCSNGDIGEDLFWLQESTCGVRDHL